MHPFLTEKLEVLLRDNAAELQDLSSRPTYVALRVYARLKQTMELIQGFADCGYIELTESQTAEVAALRQLAWKVVDQHAENTREVAQACLQCSIDLASLFGVAEGSG
jgi:hypothetical protein